MNPSDDGPLECQICGETNPLWLDEDWDNGIWCYECASVETFMKLISESWETSRKKNEH